MNPKDNLFDGKFTYLDAVKIALLIVTGFSTWNVVGIMTPDGSWSWVRQIAALIVVEGAFLGFEFATADAKSRRQVRWATIGFFCSLTVISLFAGLSGLLEFGGDTLMTQHASNWLGLSWSVSDIVQASSLLTLVLWIAVLASIYRIYTLNDPDKRAELEGIEINEMVSSEANKARRLANRDVAPVVAGHRTLAEIRSRYSGEMSVEQMQQLLDDVADNLKSKYSVRPDTNYQPAGAVAVDPERGFVPRVPPLQKVDELVNVLQKGARGVLAQVGIKPRTYHPMSKLQPNEEPVITGWDYASDRNAGLGEFHAVKGAGSPMSQMKAAIPDGYVMMLDPWFFGQVEKIGAEFPTADDDGRFLARVRADGYLDVVRRLEDQAEVKPATAGDFRNPQ